MRFNQINTDCPEGKYLLAAISLLTSNPVKEVPKQIDELMFRLEEITIKVYGPNDGQEFAATHHSRPFQYRVAPWMATCFSEEVCQDKVERCHRFLEESLELVQAIGIPKEDAIKLIDYVYGRPVGETYQEVGAVMVTLAALCLTMRLDMHNEGENELKRIWGKIEKTKEKQATKPHGSPLPGVSQK